MAGLFDDIPVKAPVAGGMFDDIPNAKGGMFADSPPAKGKVPMPDPTEAVTPDMSPLEYAGGLVKGAAKGIAQWPTAWKHGVAADVVKYLTGKSDKAPAEFKGVLDTIKEFGQHPEQSLKAAHAALVQAASDDPERFASTMVEGLAEDPELVVLPGAAGAKAGGRLIRLAKDAEKASTLAAEAGDDAAAALHAEVANKFREAARTASRVAGAKTGAALGAGESAAEQKIHGGKLNDAETLVAAALGGMGGAVSGEVGAKASARLRGTVKAVENNAGTVGVAAAHPEGGLHIDPASAEGGVMAATAAPMGVAYMPTKLAGTTLKAAGSIANLAIAPVNLAAKAGEKVWRGAASALGGVDKALDKTVGPTARSALKLGAGTGAIAEYFGWNAPDPKDQNPATTQAIHALGYATGAALSRVMLGRWGALAPVKAIPEVDKLVFDAAAQRNQMDALIAIRTKTIGDLGGAKVQNGDIMKALEKPELAKDWSPAEKRALALTKEFYTRMGADAQKVGLLPEDIIADYAPHVWDLEDPKAQSAYDEFLSQIKVGGAQATRARKYDVKLADLANGVQLEDGRVIQLTPKTWDSNAIMGQYAASMGRAITERNLVGGLRALDQTRKKVEGVDSLLMRDPGGMTPRGYTRIESPWLKDQTGKALLVSDTIAPDIKLAMNYRLPKSSALATIDNVNRVTKATNMAGSLMHSTELLRQMVFSAEKGGDSLAVLQDWMRGEDMSPELKSMVNYATSKGLRVVSPDAAEGFSGRVLTDWIARDASKAAEAGKQYSGAQLGHKALRVIELTEQMTFQRIMPAVKLTTFNDYVGAARRGLIKQGVEITPLMDDQIAKDAARYTNAQFGGMNWTAEVQAATTKMGRRMLQWAGSKGGQLAMRTMEFAPDWLYSSIVAPARAFGLAPASPELKAAHRVAMLRSAIVLAGVGEAAQQALTGTSYFDNPDLSKINYPGGGSQALDKHFFEWIHLMKEPIKFATNKLAPVGRDVAAVMQHGMEPARHSTNEMLTKIVESHAPFGVSGFVDSRVKLEDAVGATLAGIAGVPYYPTRKTDEETATERRLEAEPKLQ